MPGLVAKNFSDPLGVNDSTRLNSLTDSARACLIFLRRPETRDRRPRPTGTVALTSRSRENSGCDRCRQDTTSIATQTQDILSVWLGVRFFGFSVFGIERRRRAFRYRTAGTVVVGLSWLPCSRSPAKGLSVYVSVCVCVCVYGFGYKHTQLFRWDAAACVRFCVQPGIVLPPTAPPTFSHTNQHKSAKSSGYNTLTHRTGYRVQGTGWEVGGKGAVKPKHCISSNTRGLSCKHRAGVHRVHY